MAKLDAGMLGSVTMKFVGLFATIRMELAESSSKELMGKSMDMSSMKFNNSSYSITTAPNCMADRLSKLEIRAGKI